MEPRQGRLAAFLSKGPVQFIGAAGLCLALGVGLNVVYQPSAETPESGTQANEGSKAVEGAKTATGHAVRDTATHDTVVGHPYVPQSVGYYAFDRGAYDWQTFVVRTNDLAAYVDSAYSDDYIRALPKAADRAGVLGTGPHKLLHDVEGRALSAAYLSEHYHLNAEGLAVAVSDNPAYVGTPIRAIADNAHWLAEATAIGQQPEALRAMAQELHVQRIGVAPTAEMQAMFQTMSTKDLAAYAMVMGEAAYTVMAATGDTKGQQTAAMLVMAGAEAHYQATRTHGKFHDMPMDAEWTQQIASANDAARSARVEEAKRTGAFRGLHVVEPPATLVVADKSSKTTRMHEPEL